MMKDHHERDQLVKQSLHENVAFIKVNEGFPEYLSHNAVQLNKIKFSEQSKEIGVLDFFSSLGVMPKVISCIERANADLQEVHKPDNGLMTTALEISALKFLTAELKIVKDGPNGVFEHSKGSEVFTDNHVLGNSDKMMFFIKELVASENDPHAAHNPFVIGKLPTPEVAQFDFRKFMGYIDPGAAPNKEKEYK